MHPTQMTHTAVAAALVACAAGAAHAQYVKILPSDGASSAMFGWSARLPGQLLVGAPGHRGDSGEYDFGAVYVYDSAGGDWVEAERLMLTDPQEWDEFGASVAVSADTAVIGIPRWGNGPGSRASIFQRQRGAWIETQTISPSDGADAFGTTAAIEGDRLIVGTNEWWDYSGKVYVFEPDAGVWAETAQLTAPDAHEWDEFGASLHLGADRAVIGAPGRDLDAQENNEGAVFVFEPEGAEWGLAATLTPQTPTPGGYFGRSLAVDGDTLLVGAPGGNDTPGEAYLFEHSAGQWIQAAALAAPDGHDGDRFGETVAIRGGTALVSGAENSVYVFQQSPEGDWLLRAKIVSPDGANGFGRALALGEAEMVIGAPSDDDDGSWAGALYLAPIPHSRSPDFNADGSVNTQDVLDFLGAWSQHDPSADWDWTWRIDTRDVIAFLNDWVAGG